MTGVNASRLLGAEACSWGHRCQLLSDGIRAPGDRRDTSDVMGSPGHMREGAKLRDCSCPHARRGVSIHNSTVVYLALPSCFPLCFSFPPCRGGGRCVSRHAKATGSHAQQPQQGPAVGIARVRAPGGQGGEGGRRHKWRHFRTLTIRERVQVTKYPQTIVGPFRGHSQLLQRSSCLRGKKKKIVTITLDVTGTRGESKTLGQVGRGSSLRGGWGMGCDGGRGKEQTRSEMRWSRCC